MFANWYDELTTFLPVSAVTFDDWNVVTKLRSRHLMTQLEAAGTHVVPYHS